MSTTASQQPTQVVADAKPPRKPRFTDPEKAAARAAKKQASQHQAPSSGQFVPIVSSGGFGQQPGLYLSFFQPMAMNDQAVSQFHSAQQQLVSGAQSQAVSKKHAAESSSETDGPVKTIAKKTSKKAKAAETEAPAKVHEPKMSIIGQASKLLSVEYRALPEATRGDWREYQAKNRPRVMDKARKICADHYEQKHKAKAAEKEARASARAQKKAEKEKKLAAKKEVVTEMTDTATGAANLSPIEDTSSRMD